MNNFTQNIATSEFEVFCNRHWISATAIKQRGLDAELFLRGVFEQLREKKILDNASPRNRFFETSYIMNACIKATQDEAFPLEISSYIRPTQLGNLGVSLISSENLSQFFDTYRQYYPLFFPNLAIEINFNNEEFELAPMEQGLMIDVELGQAVKETVLASSIRAFRWLYDSNYKPNALYLTRSHHPQVATAYTRFYRCPVYFSTDKNAFVGNRSELLEPLLGANAELAQITTAQCAKDLARLDANSLTDKVEDLILENLTSGKANKETVANALNMCARTLQEKLKQEGTGFKQILERTRFQLAAHLLLNESKPVEHVAHQVGYSDISNFSRAFKKWSGESPSEYVQTRSRL